MTISIIVPIYNVEKYLDKCIGSIVSQTYTDLEIILVDDGSTDASPEICDRWGKKDQRIKVLHKANGGLSDARNAGMELATGQYVGFVDSDDWIEPRMYELLLTTMTAQKADIVECLIEKFTDNASPQSYHGETFSTEFFDAEQALGELIAEKKLHQTVVNKLYQTKIAKSVLFAVGKICEDEFWTYQVIGAARKVALINVALYHYYQRDDSIIHKPYSPKRLVALDAYEERMHYVQARFSALYPAASAAYLFACFFHYQTICRNSEIDPDHVWRSKTHQRFCDGNYKLLWQRANLKYKVWYAGFRHFPWLTCKIRNMLKIGL